ncbi:MAG: hypothetical protein ACI31G_00325 [Bacilli bacterium]
MKKYLSLFVSLLLSSSIVLPLASCTKSDVTITSIEASEIVTIEGDYEEGAEVVANEIEGSEKEDVLQLISGENYSTESDIYVFDISLEKDGEQIQPYSEVTVTIFIDDIDVNLEYSVYHILSDNSFNKIKPVVTTNKVSFTTDSFCYFIIAADGEEEEVTKSEVSVSVNILPLAEYGYLKVNDVLLENNASYKATHYEGDVLKLEAIPTKDHHFDCWSDGNDSLSTQTTYQIVVGKDEVVLSANFKGHEIIYTNITDETHTEECKHGDYSEVKNHSYDNETIIKEATCIKEGTKELSCVCGKTISDTIPFAEHNYVDGVCTECGKKQLYVRVNAAGVADPEGAYIRMGKTYCEKVSNTDITDALEEMAGNPFMGEMDNWNTFDFGAGDNDSTYYCDLEYEGINYRGVYYTKYRLDNDDNQTTNRIWTNNIMWYQERTGMWEIVSESDGQAYLVSKEIWTCQRFAETDTGDLTYETSWIRGWLQLWMDELFNEYQKEILVPNASCNDDKIFLPSLDEVGVVRNKGFGSYQYPFILGAYKDTGSSGYGTVYSPYWLRDGIIKGSDNKNYVECINSHYPFNETCKYLATKTFVGVVPAIIITL